MLGVGTKIFGGGLANNFGGRLEKKIGVVIITSTVDTIYLFQYYSCLLSLYLFSMLLIGLEGLFYLTIILFIDG